VTFTPDVGFIAAVIGIFSTVGIILAGNVTSTRAVPVIFDVIFTFDVGFIAAVIFRAVPGIRPVAVLFAVTPTPEVRRTKPVIGIFFTVGTTLAV
jgi:hypothetical protein